MEAYVDLLVSYVTAAIVLVALFAILRTYLGNQARAAGVAVAIVLAFLVGRLLPRVGDTGVVSTNAVTPAGGTARGLAAGLAPRLSQPQIDALVRIKQPAALGFIDGVGTNQRSDSPTDRFAVGSTVFAHGWAADPKTVAPGAGLILIVDGRRRIDVSSSYGQDRPDLPKALGSQALENAGFAGAQIDTHGMTKGEHRLTFGVIASGNKQFYPSKSEVRFTLY